MGLPRQSAEVSTDVVHHRRVKEHLEWASAQGIRLFFLLAFFCFLGTNLPLKWGRGSNPVELVFTEEAYAKHIPVKARVRKLWLWFFLPFLGLTTIFHRLVAADSSIVKYYLSSGGKLL